MPRARQPVNTASRPSRGADTCCSAASGRTSAVVCLTTARISARLLVDCGANRFWHRAKSGRTAGSGRFNRFNQNVPSGRKRRVAAVHSHRGEGPLTTPSRPPAQVSSVRFYPLGSPQDARELHGAINTRPKAKPPSGNARRLIARGPRASHSYPCNRPRAASPAPFVNSKICQRWRRRRRYISRRESAGSLSG